jgi:hypothetical protein
VLRKLVVAALVLIALLFWFGPVISGESGGDEYEGMLEAALLRSELNNARAEGAPQQQVVNGWTNNDLQQIQIRQQSDLIDATNRQTALLAILILLLSWIIISSRSESTSRTPIPF